MILKKEDNSLPFERKSKYVGRINGVKWREKIFPLYEQQRSKIMVTMIWCPGHCDIVYNDLADEEAKKAAEELSNVHEANSDMQSVSVSTVKKIITGMQQRDWQLSWDRSTTGERTRELIPSVKDKLHWRGIRTADMAYARMLLGRTNLNDNMFKMKFVESPDCEC